MYTALQETMCQSFAYNAHIQAMDQKSSQFGKMTNIVTGYDQVPIKTESRRDKRIPSLYNVFEFCIIS